MAVESTQLTRDALVRQHAEATLRLGEARASRGVATLKGQDLAESDRAVLEVERELAALRDGIDALDAAMARTRAEAGATTARALCQEIRASEKALLGYLDDAEAAAKLLGDALKAALQARDGIRTRASQLGGTAGYPLDPGEVEIILGYLIAAELGRIQHHQRLGKITLQPEPFQPRPRPWRDRVSERISPGIDRLIAEKDPQ